MCTPLRARRGGMKRCSFQNSQLLSTAPSIVLDHDVLCNCLSLAPLPEAGAPSACDNAVQHACESVIIQVHQGVEAEGHAS